MITWYKKLSYWKRMAFLLTLIVVLAPINVWMIKDMRDRDKRLFQYLETHNCERTGFAGKAAEPVYRCDTGLWLEYEIKGKVL